MKRSGYMKILYHHRTRRKGAEGVHIQAVVDGLRARGHEVLEVSLARSQDTLSRRLSRLASILSQSPVLCSSRFFYEVSEIAYPHVVRGRLRKLTEDFQPDAIYERYNLHNDAGVRVGNDLGIPVVLEVNTPYALERTQYDYWGKRLIFGSLALHREISTFRRADHIVTVTKVLKDYLVGSGLDPDAITVVPNGVDLALFEPNVSMSKASALKRMHGLGSFKVIGFVGSLVSSHGLCSILDALVIMGHRGAKVKAVLVGSGPESGRLRRAAVEKGIPKQVLLAGSVPHSDVPSWVSVFDIALKPDSAFWSCPIKIMEYMAMRKAIVAPDIPAIREMLIDGQDGLLISSSDPQALADAVLRLLADPTLMQQLGENARARAVAKFQWARAVGQIEDTLRNALL